MQQTVSHTVNLKIFSLAVATLAFLIVWAFLTHPVAGIDYSAGTYGACTYGSCSISLTSSGSVSINVAPTAGTTKCTIAGDIVTATTDSSTGYTVSLTDTDTSNTLNGPVSIPADTANPSSPVTLTANTWGYRVDRVAGFGAGPTSTISSGTIPSLTFAGIPISSDTPGLIRTTTTADTSTVDTSVWYGVCANSSLQNGAYSDSVTYTAVIN
ncbi:MAG TPA: hypothetical protein VIM31_00820 [Candidatus Microsaccharimonas sp.]|jgi:hypothetical protein